VGKDEIGNRCACGHTKRKEARVIGDLKEVGRLQKPLLVWERRS
jgi:hypothetical protein